MPNYAFKTTKSFRIEATAATKEKAFILAYKSWLDLTDHQKENAGLITTRYITYGRDGTAPVDSWKEL